MKQVPLQGQPSRRGIWMRELIAAAIRLAGDDIIAVGKKQSRKPLAARRPPPGFQLEKVILPDHASAEYLIPHNRSRQDIAILQLHGGAYSIGYLPIFRRRAAKIARLSGLVPVLSLDYRIAPENPYPAALDDALHAIEWLSQEKGIAPESVIVVGESAGAGLGLALAMRLRDEGTGHLKALVLMSPWTDLTCQGLPIGTDIDWTPCSAAKHRLPTTLPDCPEVTPMQKVTTREIPIFLPPLAIFHQYRQC